MPTHEFRVRSLVRLTGITGITGIMTVKKVTDTHALCIWYEGTAKIQHVFNVKDLALIQW